MKKWKVGDVVQLKSGGPKMTVSGGVVGSGYVYCRWFRPNGKAEIKDFSEESIEEVKQDRQEST